MNNSEKIDIKPIKPYPYKDIEAKWRTCPRCGKRYNEPPAISRKDNKTKICSLCGNEEAIIDFCMLHETDIPGID